MVQCKLGCRTRLCFITVLFNIFINSLVTDIKALDIGIDIDGEKNGILLYADDIVLIVENENDLQLLLDILYTWCKYKVLNVNFEKIDCSF